MIPNLPEQGKRSGTARKKLRGVCCDRICLKGKTASRGSLEASTSSCLIVQKENQNFLEAST